jgi:hypothetical protein
MFRGGMKTRLFLIKVDYYSKAHERVKEEEDDKTATF